MPRAPDWANVLPEALAQLKQMIAFRTVNPPGAELPLARHLHDTLRGAGIDSRLLEPAADRGAVVARLAAERPRAGPLLLLAHMDVVGVESEHWTVDPFAGEVREGCIYGRGAIDDKGMLATNLMAMLLTKRHVVDAGMPLSRDIIFVAAPDEEAGSRWGLEWLLEHHGELLRAELALNEGGRIRVVNGRPLYAAVQTAEKVPHRLAVTAQGTSGHAAVPHADNPITRLGRALAAIGAHREPLHLVPTTRRFLEQVAPIWPSPETRAAMADLTGGDEARVRRADDVLVDEPSLDALLRNGVSPTLVSGGVRDNVIPASATAVLDLRTLPGESPERVVARLQEAIGDPRVSIEITQRGRDAPASDHGSPMFAAIAESLLELEPRLTVAPYMSTGATDSARLRSAGVETFGLLPFPLSPEDERRMHGHDERLPVASLAFGVQVTYGIVERIAVRDE
ncbi:MAG TPA: M20/M25/M40 family metallo-hydrolase [Gemmatimonadaceae bacterium]|nr:M20/M25/M40 family metallo-hydrolase [Gemmatimonadaceae bacterium]